MADWRAGNPLWVTNLPNTEEAARRKHFVDDASEGAEVRVAVGQIIAPAWSVLPGSGAKDGQTTENDRLSHRGAHPLRSDSHDQPTLGPIDHFHVAHPNAMVPGSGEGESGTMEAKGATMRTILVSVLMVAGGYGAEVPKGAHALLRMVNSVSTRTAHEGDYVYLRTATPIVNQGAIVVPVDSYVQGTVTHAARSGRVKGTAELGIRIETLTLPGGKVIRMSPTLASVDGAGTDQKVAGKEGEVRQGTSHEADAARIAGGGMGGAAVGGMVDRSWQGAGIGGGAGSVLGLATVLLTRGREVELRQGATVDVVFDRAVALD
jgi:hypothetical protein